MLYCFVACATRCWHWQGFILLRVIHQQINTFLEFTSGIYFHIAFKESSNSAGNANHGCLIDELSAALCRPTSLSCLHLCRHCNAPGKISCCVWESEWQQAANSQTAAEFWFTEMYERCICCCNALCSTLSGSDWLPDREPDRRAF